MRVSNANLSKRVMELESVYSIPEELAEKRKEEGLTNKDDSKHLLDKRKNATCFSDILPLVFIFLLYNNQGILTGYFQAVKIILSEAGIPFRDLGHFSFITYPFAFKFIIAPIVDTYFWPSFGKKKTFIVPCYALMIILLLIFGVEIDGFVHSKNISAIVAFGILVVTLMSINDICLDGWTLKLLQDDNKAYASFCQTAGIICGKLLGYNLFIWLNSVEVSNNYIWSTPQDYPLISHKTQNYIIVVLYTITMIVLLVFVEEKHSEEELQERSDIKATWRNIKGFWTNINIRYLLFIMLFIRFGYITNNPGKDIMMRKGFKREKVAMLNLITIPVGFFSALLGSYISKKRKDMTVSYVILWLRILNEIGYYFIVSSYSREDESYLIGFILANAVVDDFCISLSNAATASFGFRISEINFGSTFLTFYFSTRNFSSDWAETLTYYLMEVLQYWMLCVIGGVYQTIFLILIGKKYCEFERLPVDYWKPSFRAPDL